MTISDQDGDGNSGDHRIAALIDSLSLAEKASLCSGEDFWYLKSIPRLGIRGFMVTDGPQGLRKQASASDRAGLSTTMPATCFPAAVNLASSWDPSLLRRIGGAIAEECLAEGVGVLLAPGVNIKRSPLCGRNFEYFSEDPLLAGELGAAFVEGLQEKGVGASLKHFAVNNQEYSRMTVDAIVDERTLREIYLRAFEIIVTRTKPWTVMCAYNGVNGTPASEHRGLLSEILRGEWGFGGLVVSDWGATKDRVKGLEAGLDLEMPGAQGLNDGEIIEAVESGRLDVTVLNRSVARILRLYERAADARRPGLGYDAEAHHGLARQAAEESIVLLQNEGPILPLGLGGRIAVIGAFATNPRYQGSGSSLMNPTRLEIPLEEIRTLVGSRGEVVWAQGYSTLSDEVDSDLHSVALEAARGADIVLVFAGLPALLESEGFDRENLGLPACQLTLIDDLATVNPATVVILQNGSAVEMPFAERVPAILECYLGGQAAASALARVLFGLAEPGGRLAETFPLVAGDCPSSQHFPGNRRQVQYREGLYVGYRWFDRGRKPLLFPFGHGLSYSSFAWTDLQLSAPMIREDEKLEVRCRITNTGPRAGSEVVQLYVRDVESSFHRPDKELRAFAKVRLGGGESAELGFVLDRRAFTFWDRTSGDWRVEGGEFRILVASSARETRLEGRVRIESASPALPLEDPALAVWRSPDRGANLGGANFSGADLDDAAFAALLGRPIPPMPIVRGFGLDSTIEELRSKLLGRIFHGLVRRGMRAQSEENHDEVVAKMEERMLAEMPLSSLVRLGGGKFTFPMAKALVDLLNGHPIRALLSFLRRS